MYSRGNFFNAWVEAPAECYLFGCRFLNARVDSGAHCLQLALDVPLPGALFDFLASPVIADPSVCKRRHFLGNRFGDCGGTGILLLPFIPRRHLRIIRKNQ